MAVEVKLPRLGQGMEEGRILRWLKAEGETVEEGEELYEVETEKVNVEVESPAGGTVLKILAADGSTVPIGTVVAFLGEPGEAVPEVSAPTPAPTAAAEPSPTGAVAAAPSASAGPAVSAVTSPAVIATAPAAGAATTPSATPGDNGSAGRLKASPLARRMAEARGIALAAISPSGPDGRVIARDIDRAAGAMPAQVAAPVSAAVAATIPAVPLGASVAAGDQRIPLTAMRATIARRLGEAWQAPAFYLNVDIDMTAAAEMRKRLLAATAEGAVRPTVSDVITRACAIALRQHPEMNAGFDGDAIVRWSAVNVGMAVATDDGLVVPVIRDAHACTVREIAAQRSELVGRARAGKLQPADFEGGTFTISNLGMLGIDSFTAVLNPPMAGILAVGRTADRVVAIDRRPEVRPMMTVTLGCDHRAVDGAVGARFLATVKSLLEDPLTMV